MSATPIATSSAVATPYSIFITTMGGQGGGGVEPMASRGGRYITTWLVAAARAAGFPVQSTLTPGTAQRTGLNQFYIEICPMPATALGGRKPIFRLAPRPGDVDAVVAFELVEAGRMLSMGLVSSDRTALVASTHRFWTVAEKAQMTDGRYDGAPIVAQAQKQARNAILFDMAQLYEEHGGSVSAVALGALSAVEGFPVPAAHIERAIAELGPLPDANLRAFAAGRAAAQTGAPASLPSDTDAKRARAPHAPERLVARMQEHFPEAAWPIIREGIARVTDYEDARYGDEYLDRLDRIRLLDQDRKAALTRETARYLALWMSYEDVIRVAELKTRPERLERLREEVGARAGEPLRVTEFLKPGIPEWTAVMPPRLGRFVRRAAHTLNLTDKVNVGLHIPSTSVWGYWLLSTMAKLKSLRRHGLGFAEENAAIDRWLDGVARGAQLDYQFGVELAECGRLIKGYSDTRHRAFTNFDKIWTVLVAPALAGQIAPAVARDAVREARHAALKDPDGRALFDVVSRHVNPANLGIASGRAAE